MIFFSFEVIIKTQQEKIFVSNKKKTQCKTYTFLNILVSWTKISRFWFDIEIKGKLFPVYLIFDYLDILKANSLVVELSEANKFKNKNLKSSSHKLRKYPYKNNALSQIKVFNRSMIVIKNSSFQGLKTQVQYSQ